MTPRSTASTQPTTIPETRVASGFVLVDERPVPLLKLSLQRYRHPSGAQHYHLASEDEHRAFNLAFGTLPDDSTGMPHILEHLVLCGSELYPVRDPFFMMIRRSLNTFMNAMTGGETTYYPFASQVDKDFQNLLTIYLDATFKPHLHPLDFAQEGWRLEPKDAADRDPDASGWQFKGVVYNEMKGAMGNTEALMSEALDRILLPDTPFRHNSGGDPAVIPELSHADLVAFHARHYAAANACFVTYGRLDLADLHARFEPYLAHRTGQPLPPLVAQAPIRPPAAVDVPVPLQEGQDPRDLSLARLAWVWGDCSTLSEQLLGELFDQLLLGHAGAPLRLALESSGLGRALGWSGFSTTGRNGVVSAALKGMDPARYDELPPLVEGVLAELAEQGFPDEEVAAALHQLELSRRTISGDRFPFGLELTFRVVEAWRSDEDPLGYLDMEAALESLRERVATPGFWQTLIRKRLLDNPHRSFLRARPEPGYNADQAAAEQRRLDARVAALDTGQREALLRSAEDLAQRQASQDDVSVLPDLALSDVPSERRWAQGRPATPGLSIFETGTNGILHQVVTLPLTGLSAEDVALLPLLTRAIGELGVGRLDYRQQAARLNALCGGVSAWTDLRGRPDDLGRMRGRLLLEISGLARRESEWSGILAETLSEQRFDEHDRLRELLEQSLAGLQQRVSWSGNSLALSAAARGFGGPAGLSHQLGGLGRLAWLKAFEQEARADAGRVTALAERLAKLLAHLRGGSVRLALIGDAAAEPAIQASLLRAWEGWALDPAEQPEESVLPTREASTVEATAYTTASQVSYCALAFPTVPMEHPDSAPLAVAARYLTNNFLHGHLREQGGAYGGSASFASQSGLFGLTSYRDPRLADTFADMRAGLAWLAEAEDDAQLLKEAILGVIGSVDRPASPSGEARHRFEADLFGFGPERVNAWRQQVLATRGEDLHRVAARWLPAEGGVAAVVTGDSLIEASGLGWPREAI